MIRHLWTIPALLWSVTMRAGRRYGARSFRWNVQRAMIKERDGHRCTECGTRSEYGTNWLEIHHKRRVADGGNHSPLNLVTLCVQCHRQKPQRSEGGLSPLLLFAGLSIIGFLLLLAMSA